MKFLFFAGLATAFAAVAVNEPLPNVSSKAALRAAFADYQAKHSKNYAATEIEARMSNFFEAVHDVAMMRAAYPSAVFNLGHMADMSRDEQREARGLMKPQPKEAVARSCLAKGVTKETERALLEKAQAKVGAPPATFSWLDTPGVVGPVLNQGQCGSCWAFSTAESIMAAYAIKTKTPTLELSPQEIVDCSHACSSVEGQQVCNQGCNGGWPWAAMDDIISWKGLAKSSAYPYTAITGTCERDSSTKAFAPITNYTCLSGPYGNNAPGPANEVEMQSFLMAHGPLSMAMDATPLQYYVSGVVDPWSFNPFGCGQSQLDHALLIVGWGTYDSDLWGKQPYWLVKNSWGEGWGESGYFKILRGNNECGLASAVTFPVVA